MNKLYTLIMAGGSGTRFWPLSKVAKPKQYLKLIGSDSLLQSTVKRFSLFIPTNNIYVVSGKSQAGILEQQVPELPKLNLIYEPIGKNTLPCIGLAAMFVEKENPEGIMVVTPSDHLIRNDELFRDTVLAAAKIAVERDGIVTIGITPSYPATGYGYVQTAVEITGSEKIRQYKVERFVEKPNEEKALEYIRQGGYYWNSGMFIFKIAVFLEELKKLKPALYSDLRKIQTEIGKASFEQTLDTIYRSVESISVEGNFVWNDLGSWESVYLTNAMDENGNAISGESVVIGSKNSYIYSDSGLVALVGLDDVIVVKEGNITLVCKRDQAETIKSVVDQLKSSGKSHYL